MAGLILGYLGITSIPFLAMVLGFPPWGSEDSRNQAAAVQNLGTLNIALQTYAASYGKGFPEQLRQLGPPTGDAALDVNASGFVAPALASGKSSGYTLSYNVTGRDADGRPIAYSIHADPAGREASGQPHFFTDQTQLIRTEANRLATAGSPPLPEQSRLAGAYLPNQ